MCTHSKVLLFSAADSGLFVDGRETANETEPEPTKLSSLSFGGGNTETSSTPATSHTPSSRTTTFLMTTTPRETTPTGPEESSEEGA